MKSLIGYFRNYRLQSILSPVFKLLEACFELAVPLIVAGIIDKGITGSDTEYIKSHIWLLVLFAVVGFASAICAQYFAAYSATGVSSDIRRALFDKLFRLKVSQYEKIGSSQLITSLTSDVNQISSGINLFLRLLLRSPFIVAGACIMAFTIDWRLALIFVLTVAVLSVFVAFNMRSAIPAYHKTRQGLDVLVDSCENGISGIKVIRGFNRSSDDMESFKAKSGLLCKAQKTASDISAWLNPVTYMLINLAICLLIYRGSIHVNAGTLTQGETVALYNYMSQILVELIKLANLIVTVSRAVACASRVEKILAIPEDGKEQKKVEFAAGSSHSVEFRNVHFTYSGNSEESITDISFKIEPGEKIGITGRTGSGKSTIASLLTGMYCPDSGEVLIDGIDIEDIPDKDKTSGIGMALQKTRMFSGTIKDNITAGRTELSSDAIDRAAYLSCSDEIISGKTEGLDYKVSAEGSGLSGGQKQRIGIARTLVSKPGLIVLDDSTSALDSGTEKRLLDRLDSLDGDPTIVLISQKIRTLKSCDRIMLVDDGRIVAFAGHDELLDSSEEYRSLCQLQGEDAS